MSDPLQPTDLRYTHSHGDGHTHSHPHMPGHSHEHGHSHGHNHGGNFPDVSRRGFLAGLLATFASQTGLAQQTETKAERFARQSAELKQKGLSEPFVGVTTNGQVIPNLYPIARTGVSTLKMRNAAESFIKLLTPEQKQKALFPIDDPQWRNWANQHWYIRAGVSFAQMSDAQRNSFYAFMQVCLSPKGYDLMRNLMCLNETLAEMTNDHVFLSEYLYFVTFLGTPSATEPWGWQLQGHHGDISYFILGDQIVMTPLFVGGEPVIAESGKYKGVQILQDEQNLARLFVNRLDSAARAKAILSSPKKIDINVSEAFKDNVIVDYAGVPVSSLPNARRQELLDLIELYVGNVDEGHAKIKMDEVKRRLQETHFAWIGNTDEEAVFYYRIQSPVLMIEFDHQIPRSLNKILPADHPSKKHIHCVVRTPNGGDYGKDLLREHYLNNPHT